MTQYPGDDPDDPFAKPPKQDGGQSRPSGDETAPIYGTGQPDQTGQTGQTANPWAGYGQPAGSVPPPPPPPSPTGDPGAAYPPQPYYGAQPTYVTPPNHPNAVTALVLGIISIACCGIAGPFAWYIGGKARREIRASNGQLGGDGQATAGWIMGIIATALIALAVVFIVVILVIGLASSSTSSGFNA